MLPVFRVCFMQLIIDSADGDIVRARLTGRITQKEVSATFDPFTEELGDEAYSRKILLDMKGAEYVDSSGIGWLLACNKRFETAGGGLVMYAFVRRVLDVIRVLRMQMVLSIAATEQEAIEKLNG